MAPIRIWKGGRSLPSCFWGAATFRLMLTSNMSTVTLLLAINRNEEPDVTQPRSDVLQGTLDLMVLKTLHTLGAMHGYGIAQRIQQVSENLLQLNQGTLYPALLRLEQRGWISSKWGTSENNRRARFYSLTKNGRKQLERETEGWQRIVGVMDRLLGSEGA